MTAAVATDITVRGEIGENGTTDVRDVFVNMLSMMGLKEQVGQ